MLCFKKLLLLEPPSPRCPGVGCVTSQKNVYVGVFKIRVQLRASCYWNVSARHQRDGARRQIKIDGG